MKFFHCDRCEQILYFENTKCLSCGSEVGYLPDKEVISSLEPQGDDRFKALQPTAQEGLYKKCKNYRVEKVCNWMMPAESPDAYCRACELNVTIPDLSKGQNRLYWHRLEDAKRRLLYNLLRLNLPVLSRRVDSKRGIAFQFLEDEKLNFKETKKIMTGHSRGLITINVAEADDALRVQMRLQMKEEYRTVLGHFRHEVGHYYWTQLIENSPHLTTFREIFGDERQNYTQALNAYYQNGPYGDWSRFYVSAYAATHPSEDWAETWAHYLHMVDTLETAQAWGLHVAPQPKKNAAVPKADDDVKQDTEQSVFRENQWTDFDSMYQSWTWMVCAINSMNRSMGLRDFYPFVLSLNAVNKIKFVDRVIKENKGARL